MALANAERLDWQLTPVNFMPLFALAALLYESPWVAERYAAINKFIVSVDAMLMDPVVYSIIMNAREFSAADAFQSQYLRQDLSRKIKKTFGRFDALLVPTTPTFPSIE
ncbi:Urea amidolyase [Penicillium subrubescens]|uniref:Urea amidolyase n=1 Tax=Penicillium subrubescens TaxID=1316194 RepID=A0A1Q5TU90_9EURO|nr:Urea amidolyase [Penicillium subrubescens]